MLNYMVLERFLKRWMVLLFLMNETKIERYLQENKCALKEFRSWVTKVYECEKEVYKIRTY